MRKTGLIFLPFLFLVGCGDKSSARRCYKQNFPQPVALAIIEMGNSPRYMASAFLFDREKGFFITADHFVDKLRLLGVDKFKLFFSGRAYNASPRRVFQLYDLAIVGIDDDFDYQNFPQPYKLARDTIALGDTLYVQGIHTHPRIVGGHRVNILEGCYGIELKGKMAYDIVFDNLGSKVEALNIRAMTKDLGGGIDRDLLELRSNVNRYVGVRTFENHKISFAGLSGGPVVNTKEELVGLVTAEPLARFKVTKIGIVAVYDRILITPLSRELVESGLLSFFDDSSTVFSFAR